MKVQLMEYPTELDWVKCKQRALVTIGKTSCRAPSFEWKCKILRARHSPIRCLRFSFYLEIPYWVSVHLSRHIHAQPYIQSQRNDRQDNYDRESARQDEIVKMIWDMEAEELITISNKRLCKLASEKTRDVVKEMCRQVIEKCPEFEDELVPNCMLYGECREIYSCGGK